MEVTMATTDPFAAAPTADYFARYGTAVLALAGETDTNELHTKLVEALRADSRVVDVQPGAMNSNWTITGQMYPAYSDPGVDALLSGYDHLHTVRYSDGILFEVRVPSKNQPEIYGVAPVPEEYLVAWDGMTAVVLWRRKRAEVFPPSSAGQVVIEILEQAARRTNNYLYVQPCSGGCELMFGHTAMTISHWANSDQTIDSTVGEHQSTRMRVAGTFSKLGFVEAIHDEIKMAGAEFAATKNLARRIIQIERAAREMTVELIRLDYLALKVSQRHFIVRIGKWFAARWDGIRGRGAAKRARYLIAALWLAMASIETLQQAHAQQLRDFDDTVADEPAIAAMFLFDLKSDEMVVDEMDASFARAAIDHKTSRMESRSVVIATVTGAVVGGILALLGGWLAAAVGLFT